MEFFEERTRRRRMAFRVLVVDDDEAVRKALATAIFTKFQCEVHEASNPKEARDLLETYSYALVVTDLSFSKGKLQGLSLVEHIAGMPMRPGIVVVSGYEIANPLAIARGADAFLAQPVQLDELVAVLRKVMNRKTQVTAGEQVSKDTPDFDQFLQEGGTQIFVQPIYRIDRVPPAVTAIEFLTRGPAGSKFERPDILFSFARELHKECILDRHCVQMALTAAVQVPNEIGLSLNVHASTLCTPPEFSRWLADTAIRAGIDPHRITVEIVEHAPAWNQSEFLETLGRLREMGVKIALDDVGLGQSNYQMMIDARPDCFKLDRYFVHGCSSNPQRRAVISSIVRLASDFGAKVIAEGVAEEADLREIRAMGITMVQGYIFCPPKPLAEGWGSIPSHAPEAGSLGMGRVALVDENPLDLEPLSLDDAPRQTGTPKPQAVATDWTSHTEIKKVLGML
jgi:EAL domain-containing protein (putative c-di-GMP-specific phosphodiesterase class I)